MSNQEENPHTVEKCPFGITIQCLKDDMKEIKNSLIGDERGNMGLAAKVNLMWALNLAIVGLLLLQVAPVFAHLIGISGR